MLLDIVLEIVLGMLDGPLVVAEKILHYVRRGYEALVAEFLQSFDQDHRCFRIRGTVVKTGQDMGMHVRFQSVERKFILRLLLFKE